MEILSIAAARFIDFRYPLPVWNELILSHGGMKLVLGIVTVATIPDSDIGLPHFQGPP